MKRATPLLLLACLATSAGCVGLDDARLEGRLRRMARAAYATSPGACNGVVHSVDYAKGFEEGYYDVASGGDGCPPALPPKKYWRATYGSPVGQDHVDAWFQGFRDGAASAKAEGAGSFGVIRVSAESRYGVERSKNMPRIVLPMTGPRVKPPPEAEPSIPPPPLPDAPPAAEPERAPPVPESPAPEPERPRRGRTTPPTPAPPKSSPRKEQRPAPQPPPIPIPTAKPKESKSTLDPVAAKAPPAKDSASDTGTFRLSLPKRTVE